jgi:ferredoxin--NADP+ reductase
MVRLRAGDPLWVMRKASGFLTLSEIPEARHLWLLSTGTAIGPFLSILHTAEPWERFERVVLVHAVRYARELSFADSIAALLSRHPGRFEFIPFVSREAAEFALPGRITTAIANRQLEARAQLEISPEHSQIMICGNPDMVKDTSTLLETRGLRRNRRREPGHITVENYW